MVIDTKDLFVNLGRWIELHLIANQDLVQEIARYQNVVGQVGGINEHDDEICWSCAF